MDTKSHFYCPNDQAMKELFMLQDNNNTIITTFSLEFQPCIPIFGSDDQCIADDEEQFINFLKSFFIVPQHKYMGINFQIFDGAPFTALHVRWSAVQLKNGMARGSFTELIYN